MKEEQRRILRGFADWGKAVAQAVVGLVVLVLIHQMPAFNLFGFIPTSKIFFVANFAASLMLVFGVAGVLAPQVFLEAANNRRGSMQWMRSLGLIATATLGLVLAFVSAMYYLLRV